MFRWNSLDIISHMQGEYINAISFTDESYWVLTQWLEDYDIEEYSRVTTAHLELTTRDADGTILQQVTWTLPHLHYK